MNSLFEDYGADGPAYDEMFEGDDLDVRPLSGIFSGGGTSSMFVQVDVTRLA